MAESAGTAVPSRQVSIIVDDGRFGPGAVPTTDPAATAAGNAAADATDGAEVLVLARVVLDPVAIAGEALAASPTAAEQPLSAGVPDFLGGACVGGGTEKYATITTLFVLMLYNWMWIECVLHKYNLWIV